MPTYVMAKPIGSICNLDCSYCYYLEKENLYKEGGRNLRMSDEVLEKYIQSYMEAQPVPQVLFTWHGGETLMRDKQFYYKALAYQKKYGRGRQIDNSLQTNGTLLTDDWCKFFKDNNFLIGVSLDGPEHCHDVYRKDKAGKGTFKDVMRGVELLQKHGVEFNILAVINDYNVNYPLEVYHFFKAIGAHYMQFSPIVERMHINDVPSGLKLMGPEEKDEYVIAPWTVDARKFGQFYIDIFDEWVLNDVGQYYVQIFDATLANTVGEQPGSCIYAKKCGHASVLEFNGDVYACDHYVFPEYKLGNIKHKTIYEMIFSEEQLRFGSDKRDKLPSQCLQCEFLDLCHGECPKNRILTSSTGEPGLNWLCEGFKMYYSHTQAYMEFMANELFFKRSPAHVMAWAKERRT